MVQKVRQVFSFYEDGSDVQFYLKNMLMEIERKNTGFETVCQDFLDILLIRLLRKTNFSQVLASAREDLSSDTVAVRRYIENHYREPLTLDLLAANVHMNKFHLAHTFSKEFGIYPINYIQQLRIRESKDLLCTTDYPLTQIASMCGFSSSSYFSQRFRTCTGMSPAEFRKQNKEKEAPGERK